SSRTVPQTVANLLCGPPANHAHGVRTESAAMRRNQQIVVRLRIKPQRMRGDVRLAVENVEPSGGKPSALQRLQQGSLVGQRAARGVEENRPRLDPSDQLGRQQPTRLFAQ